MAMKILNRNFSKPEILKKSNDPKIGLKPAQLGHISPKFLHIEPRYHRWHVDPGVDWLETNTGYAHLEWSIPLPHTALVLVDVWQRHYLKDTEERGEAVIDNQLVPMLASCRQYGMNIIHAPSPGVAKQHPNWVKLIKKEELEIPKDDWPPEQFRNLSG